MAVTPLRFANTRGFPMIEVQSVTTSGTIATFNFNDHPQRRGNFFGGFWVKVPAITTTTTTAAYTIEFATLGVTGSNVKLYFYGGTQATLGDLETDTGGVMLCFYDAVNGRLQVIGLNDTTT